MDKETVIALARNARLPACHAEHPVALGRFAALVEKHLTTNSIHSCHPNCERPICVAVREAVKAEREACAKVAEASPSYDWHRFACETAAAIRSRA